MREWEAALGHVLRHRRGDGAEFDVVVAGKRRFLHTRLVPEIGRERPGAQRPGGQPGPDRAAADRGGAGRPGRARSADRAGQPRAAGRPDPAGDRLGGASTAGGWPCCSSTSTASSWSTTASGTRPATSCCSAVAERLRDGVRRGRHRRAPRRRRVRACCCEDLEGRAEAVDVAERAQPPICAPVRRRAARESHVARQHRHRARRRRGDDRRDAAARRRHRDVPGQGAGQERGTTVFDPAMRTSAPCAGSSSSATCARRWTATSSRCTTSRSSTWPRARSIGVEALVRWQHPTRAAAARARSSRSPRRPASSSRSATGCSTRRARQLPRDVARTSAGDAS